MRLAGFCALVAVVMSCYAASIGPTSLSVVTRFARPGLAKSTHNSRLPLDAHFPVGTFVSTVHMSLPAVHAEYYDLYVDDCIEQISINGVNITDVSFPLCEDGVGINFGSLLHEGENTLEFLLRNYGGSMRLDIRVSNADPKFFWFMHGVFCVAAIGIFYFLAAIGGSSGGFSPKALTCIVIVGAWIRWGYAFATPYWIRAYDWFDHLDYVRWIASKVSIPPAHIGFEFHQTPLYYIASAVLLHCATSIGSCFHAFIGFLQCVSIVLSIVSFLVVVRLLREMPKIYCSATSSLLFLALVGFLPGLVYNASRISNDSLLQLFTFLAIVVLIQWWHCHMIRQWVISSILISLAILTKLSALPVLGAMMVLALCVPRHTVWERIRLLLILLCIVSASYSWYGMIRYYQCGSINNSFAVGINKGLELDASVSELVSFNVSAMLKHPFVDSWSDESRRSCFLEYFYRSIFFGEFEFPEHENLARLILLSSLVLIVLMIVGMPVSMFRRWNEAIPMLVILLFHCVAIAIWRLAMPYSPTQDFRIVSTMSIPAAYFVCAGTYVFGDSWHRVLSVFAAIPILCWIVFLVQLIVA